MRHGVAATFDDGKTWTGIGVDLEESGFAFDPTDGPGGEHCRLRVYVTDGFNTANADSATFRLPVRPPRIIVPDGEDIPVGADGRVELSAVVVWSAMVDVEDQRVLWFSGDRRLGAGATISVRLAPGKHELRVEAHCEGECRGVESVVVDVPRRPGRC